MVNYYNPYLTRNNQLTELQNMRDSLNNQIQQMQQQSIPQIPQPTNLTQNFQLAPNNNTSNLRIIDNENDVQKEIVLTDTYFLLKDNSTMWIKNAKGDIRSFTVEEIIPKDDKDILIEKLQKEIEQLKGGNVNANREYSKPVNEQLYDQSSKWDVESVGNEIKTDQSTDVSTISNSKTAKRKS